MRYLLLIILGIFVTFACVKQPSTDPNPTLEYKNVSVLRKATGGGLPPRDTAVLVLGYTDGDGDLFRNSNADGANLIYTIYAFNPDSNKFVVNGGPFGQIMTQPADGYYKGKSIQGDIYVPMTQFRSGDDIKIIKFEAFMVDMQKHKTNVVSSPAFTLTF